MAQVESRQMMRAIARPGGRVKMHCSGVGKAILAWLPEREVGAGARAAWPAARHREDAGHAQGAQAELEQVRARGYAVDDEEHAVGLRCVAAPILDEHGVPLAGLSVSGRPRASPDHAGPAWGHGRRGRARGHGRGGRLRGAEHAARRTVSTDLVEKA